MSLRCQLGWHKNVSVAYGYPPGRRTWLTIYRCKRCGRYHREWDDLFAEPRPPDWDIRKDTMVYQEPVPDSVATWRR